MKECIGGPHHLGIAEREVDPHCVNKYLQKREHMAVSIKKVMVETVWRAVLLMLIRTLSA